MSDVTFNEPHYQSGPSPKKSPSFFDRILIATGLARDEASARRLLIIATVICFVLAAIVAFYGYPREPRAVPPGSLHLDNLLTP